MTDIDQLVPSAAMTENMKLPKLKLKMLKTRELYSIIGEKPQNLELCEIVDRVKGFLVEQLKLWDTFAFAEGIAVGNAGKNIAQFDPIESYKKYPSALDNIILLVNHDMDYREEELINEAENFKS